MAILEIKKETGGYFRFTLDGDLVNSIIDNAPNLTSFGNSLNFKTKNGANIIKKQFIQYNEVSYYDVSDTLFTFGSVDALWLKLISEGFFDGLGTGGGGSGVDRFDNLLDTFTYIGNDGKVPVVDQAQLKLVPTTFYNFKDFIQLEDVAITNLIENKILTVALVGGVPKIVLTDPPAEPEQLVNTVGHFIIADLETETFPISYTSGDEIITNDNNGVLSSSDYAPYGVSSLWNSSTNRFDFNELGVGDEVTLVVKLRVDTTATNQNVKLKLKLSEGELDEEIIVFKDIIIQSISSSNNVTGIIKFFIESESIRTNPCALLFSSSNSADFEVATFEPTIIRKGINVLDININGTDFVKKTYAQNYSYSIGTTNAVFPLRDNGASVYTLTNSGLISVSGFDLSLIVGSAEIPYSGKTIRIINQTGNDITLKHYDDTNAELPLFLKGGTDLFMPHNETIEFYYSPTELTEVFKSWGGNTDLTIVRDKFTFSVSQSFTLTNVPTKILFVAVNGQILDETQYNLASDEITILDTLDSGDVVLVVYDLSSHVYVEDNVALIKDNFVFVDKAEDLPNPISTVYNLEDNTAYYFTKSVDLLGGRLVCGQNTVILGSSSENVTLSSTGLTGTALIASNYSLPIRNITITADVALDLNGDGATTALDWFGVNFKDCNNVGTIQNYTNHVWTDCAFLNSGGLTYDGSIGSVAINSSLFDTDSGQTAITITSTCTLSRRFRIIYSAFIVLSGETGINFSTSATVPVEGYILDTVNFAGGGTYTTGVTFSDNKAKFTNSVGVSNSNETAQYYMNGNVTTTTITAINTPVKISGTTTNSSITQRFTHTDNRATYVGAITRVFKISVTVTLIGAVNHQIGCYISKNGMVLDESETYVTTNGSGKSENISLLSLVSMSNGDYIEIFIEDTTNPATNILVSNLNVIIQ